MNDVRQRLNNQSLAQDFSQQKQGKSGRLQIRNFIVPVNSWVQLLANNSARSYLLIKNVGGNLGYCKVEMSLDNPNQNAVLEIEEFHPRFIPTNVFVYVSDPLATGSTVVNVQVMEG